MESKFIDVYRVSNKKVLNKFNKFNFFSPPGPAPGAVALQASIAASEPDRANRFNELTRVLLHTAADRGQSCRADERRSESHHGELLPQQQGRRAAGTRTRTSGGRAPRIGLRRATPVELIYSKFPLDGSFHWKMSEGLLFLELLFKSIKLLLSYLPLVIQVSVEFSERRANVFGFTLAVCFGPFDANIRYVQPLSLSAFGNFDRSTVHG